MSEQIMNKEQAFLLYCTFTGDVERTAHALNVRPVDVLQAAEECGWLEKLEPILRLKKSGRPGDVERSINRAINYVTAHRLRTYLERVVNELTMQSQQELREYLFLAPDSKTGEETRKLTTRALTDLSAALEKCQALTYAALDDTARARDKRIECGQDGESSGAMHAAIARAMSAVGADNSPRALLIDAQVRAGEQIARETVRPSSPLDSDEH